MLFLTLKMVVLDRFDVSMELFEIVFLECKIFLLEPIPDDVSHELDVFLDALAVQSRFDESLRGVMGRGKGGGRRE